MSGRARKNRRGSALVIVACFSLILMIVASAFLRMSTGLAFSVGKIRRQQQAQALAESGVNDIMKKLATDFETYKQCNYNNSLGGGSYAVTVVTNGRTGAIVTSIGTLENESATTVLEVLGDWVSGWNTNIFGEYGIFADGLVDQNGNGTLHASVYSGTQVDLAPGTTVEGSVLSVGGAVIQGTVLGSTNLGVARIEPPTFDFEYFKNLALTYGGFYFNGNKTFKNETVNPPSGVIAVNGEVKIQNGAIIMGAIVATGDILMTGGHIQHVAMNDPSDPSKELPSLMSITGDVQSNGGQTLNGFIYAAGNVVLNGGDKVYGGVIAGGTVDARADWQIFPGDGDIPPGLNPSADGLVTGVRIGAWLR